jgi:hypothetical protein
MNDLFDLPPERELPDAVRTQARARIVAGIRGEDRRPRRALVPISIAAAAVVLVGGAAGLIAVHHDSGLTTPAGPAGSTAASGVNDAGIVPPEQAYQVVDGSASADLTARCAAQNSRKPAGRADPTQWQPIFTATAQGLSVIAFHTSAGPLFCELTPASVTLSAPTDASAGDTAEPTFVTGFGTVAGVVGPGVKWLYAKTTGDQTVKIGNVAVLRDGVFVVPNGVSVPAPSVTLTTFDTARPTGPGRSLVVNAGQLALAPTTDKPVPPADRASAGGQRLTNCFAHAPGPPVIDPAAWNTGGSATLDDHETMQLGRYDGLLAVCTFDTRQQPDVSLSVHDGEVLLASGPSGIDDNPYIVIGQAFYDFHTQPGGADGSDVVAVIGFTKSAKVATVRLSRKGKPTITASVSSGTFVLPGVDLNDYETPSGPPTMITVLDRSGAALTQLPLHS